jgi:hypothetical protein
MRWGVDNFVRYFDRFDMLAANPAIMTAMCVRK